MKSSMGSSCLKYKHLATLLPLMLLHMNLPSGRLVALINDVLLCKVP